MSLATCADADILRGRIVLPLRGPWTADLVLDTATAPSGSVAVVARGGLSLQGYVLQAGVQLDTAHVRLVGGAGGLGRQVLGAFRTAQLRDPLDAIMAASGESLSGAVASAILGVSLPYWTLAGRAAHAIDGLCSVATDQLGEAVGWRILSDGTVWLGAEAWVSAKLPAGADILDRFPAERRTAIGVETPALLPGVELADVGRLVAVEHWIGAEQVRTFAWT